MSGALEVDDLVPGRPRARLVDRPERAALWLAVLLSGAAGLTWEVLWQHQAALALGVSAFGAAVTLAALMAGFAIGGLLASRLAQSGRLTRPMRAYGLAELIIGASGLSVPVGLRVLSTADTQIYAHSPQLADAMHALGVGALLLVPGAAMGATLPLLAPWARRVGTTLPTIYALNTAGAVLGVLLATFVALPLCGVWLTTLLGAALNFAVGLWALTHRAPQQVQAVEGPSAWPPPRALALAFSSAFAVFALEVSWFRSLRAAQQATTETFSSLIAAFLIALSLGGWLAPRVRRRFPGALPVIAVLAAFAVLSVTPLVDELDRVTTGDAAAPATALLRFVDVLCRVLVPATLLGMLFPWLLAEHATTTSSGRLYAVNTLGAVLGSLLAGFVLLPHIGASATSWAVGVAMVGVSLLLARSVRIALGALLVGGLGLGLALHGQGGGARYRVQGFGSDDFGAPVFVSEGPDSTVSVAREHRTGRLALVIDGFQASGEGPGTGYMRWMGHLPALATPRLGSALVICFGTGQTANAVRSHHPGSLRIVDVSAAVFAAAPLFELNEAVLADPRVHPVVMDGRAFLRRGPEARFDAITLEPMPPNHAGVNGLYSVEFYELVRAHLQPTGSVAQWLPIHLIAPEHMRAIVGSFVRVFPHARLWIDPDGTGILVGGTRPWTLRASSTPLPLSTREISARFLLDGDALRALSAGHRVVTDDNQLLSYGLDRLSRSSGRGRQWWRALSDENLGILESYASPGARTALRGSR